MLTERLIHTDFHDLAAVQAEHEAALLALPNVVGVAVGHKYAKGENTGQRCVTVLVDMKLDRELLGRDDTVPGTIGSVPTDVREVGILQAGAGPALAPQRLAEWPELIGWEREHPQEEVAQPPREQFAALSRAVRGQGVMAGAGFAPTTVAKLRPAPGGTSIGHYRGTAGTLGVCCFDYTHAGPAPAGLAMPHRFYLLSNNHVLANCNEATMGDPILQPAIADGGNPATDTIGWLARFVPLRFALDRDRWPINFVDAAIAEGRFDQLDRRIHWIGDLRGINPAPKVGSLVQKCGRASFYTTGAIVAVNATVKVDYPGGRMARFAKQIICAGLSSGGDSGAVVVDIEQRAIGLLFATSTTISVMNPITLVEQLLDIRIAESLTNGRPRG